MTQGNLGVAYDDLNPLQGGERVQNDSRIAGMERRRGDGEMHCMSLNRVVTACGWFVKRIPVARVVHVFDVWWSISIRS
jgi:hypothetical protein